VRILIVNVAVEDSHGTLLAELKARVRRDMESLRVVVRRHRRVVVLTRTRAGNVEPVSGNIHRFAELDVDRRIVRRVNAVRGRLGCGYGWTFEDWLLHSQA